MARTAPALLNADHPPSGQGSGVPVDFQRECVEFFAEVVDALGVPRSYGQIYGLLFASMQPLSFTDIVQKLEISRGSASQGLQALRQLGVVHLADARDAHQRPESGDLRPEGSDGHTELRGEDGRTAGAARSAAEGARTEPGKGGDGRTGGAAPERNGGARSSGHTWGDATSNGRPLGSDGHTEPRGEDGRTAGAARSAAEGARSGRPLGSDGHKPETVRGGGRRDLYVPELRLRQLVGGLLREKVDPIVSGTAARMKTLRAHAATAVDQDSKRFSLDRVKKLENWRRQTGMLLPVLKTILGPGRA